MLWWKFGRGFVLPTIFTHRCSRCSHTLLVHQSTLLSTPYVGSATRVGQALHYRPRILRLNEWDILTEGGELVHYTSSKPAIDENVENTL